MNNLEKRIERVCRLLSRDYLSQGDRGGSQEALKNITLARTDAVPRFDPFQRLCDTQRKWERLMKYTERGNVSSAIKEIIEEGNIHSNARK